MLPVVHRKRKRSREMPRPAWPKRLPRKQRSDVGHVRSMWSDPACATLGGRRPHSQMRQRSRVDKRPRPEGQESRAAKHPAFQDGPAQEGDDRFGHMPLISQRLVAGRTPARLQHLIGMHLLRQPRPLDGNIKIAPGVAAHYRGQPVFVIGTFSRRSTPMVDVLPLCEKRNDDGDLQYEASCRSVLTCKQCELCEVGSKFYGVVRNTDKRSCGGRLTFTTVEQQEPICKGGAHLARELRERLVTSRRWSERPLLIGASAA